MRFSCRTLFVADSRRALGWVLLCATLILMLRKTSSLLQPQFWAEDGIIFFLQQYDQGITALLEPYAGYYHLLPRLLALLAASCCSYALAPVIYNYSSLLLTLLVVASVFSPRLRVPYKPLLALVIVLVPHPNGEVFITITNLQWLLSLLLIMLLLKEPPDARYSDVTLQRAGDYLLLVVCGFTGPFLVFLSPLFVYRWCRQRNVANTSMLLLVLGIVGVQLAAIINTHLHTPATVIQWQLFLQVLGYKLFGALFLGEQLPQYLSAYWLVLAYLLLLMGLIALAPRQDSFVPTCLSLQLLIVCATLFKFKYNPEALLPVDQGARYFYIPYVLMLWSIIVLLDQEQRWRRLVLQGLLSLALLSSLTSEFRAKPLVDYAWGHYSQLIGKKNITIPLNPAGWKILVSKHPYTRLADVLPEDVLEYQLLKLADYLGVDDNFTDIHATFVALNTQDSAQLQALILHNIDLPLGSMAASDNTHAGCVLEKLQYQDILADERFVRLAAEVRYPDGQYRAENWQIVDEQQRVQGYLLAPDPALLTAQPAQADKVELKGYLLRAQIDQRVQLVGLQSHCRVTAVLPSLPYRLKKISLTDTSQLLSSAELVGINAWQGADIYRTQIPGFTVWGSYVHSDEDMGRIRLRAHKNARLFYRSGPTVGKQYLSLAGQPPTILPVALEWVELEFSHAQLPASFEVILSDEGQGWGEWAAVGLRTAKQH